MDSVAPTETRENQKESSSKILILGLGGFS